MTKHKRKFSQHGEGFWSDANDWLKKHKVISTVGNALGGAGIPWGSKIAGVAGQFGYSNNHHNNPNSSHFGKIRV